MNADVYRILAVLAADPATSSGILDRIAAVSPEGAPPLTTFYRRLKEAVDHGWVETVPATEEEAAAPGRPGRTFRITEVGREAARKEAARQRGFADLLLPEDGAGG